jgi:GNAT superfamily N-acetyltransferase
MADSESEFTAEAVGLMLRRAAPRDARTLAELRYEFRSALSPAEEDRADFVARCESWMQPRLAGNTAWHCWVAELDGEIVGNVWLEMIEKMPNPVGDRELHTYLTSFFVRTGKRGAGIGSALLRTALFWAESQRVDAVILWPTPDSRPLYARHGFAQSGMLERSERSHPIPPAMS